MAQWLLLSIAANYFSLLFSDVKMHKGKLLMGPIGVNKSTDDPLWKPPADWYDDEEDDVFGKDNKVIKFLVRVR